MDSTESYTGPESNATEGISSAVTIREIKFPANAMRRAKKIRVLLMDVDGTMTPGVVCLQSFPDGSVAEMKVFNAHDGAGIKLASIMGIRTGLITGRDSTGDGPPRAGSARWNS